MSDAKRTATISLCDIKDPDGWGELISDLGLTDEMMRRHFTYGEYADLELNIEVDGDALRVVGGRIVPRTK